MSARNLIYGLTDPRTDEVRYIGKSSSGLRRPRGHGTSAILKKNTFHSGNWIRSLQAHGLRYGIRVLEEVPTKIDLPDVERFWIAQGRGLGWPLTNLTKGGDGSQGWVPSPETCRKIGDANRGKRRSEEFKKHVGEMFRGKKRAQFSTETRERMRLAQLRNSAATSARMLGRVISRASRLKNAATHGVRPFADAQGNVFRSFTDAAIRLGVSRGTVRNTLAGRSSKTGLSFHYIEAN